MTLGRNGRTDTAKDLLQGKSGEVKVLARFARRDNQAGDAPDWSEPREVTLCQYYGQTVVVGSVYTQQGQYYVGQNPGITCEGLLEDFVGKAEDVWTKESITRCLFLLAGTYLSCVPLFGFCVMSLVQALYCASIKKT